MRVSTERFIQCHNMMLRTQTRYRSRNCRIVTLQLTIKEVVQWIGSRLSGWPLLFLVVIPVGVYGSRAYGSGREFAQAGRAPECAVPESRLRAVGIAAGDFCSLALSANGSVVAWGDDSMGQCSPPGNLSVACIAAGAFHGVAFNSNGALVVWGYKGTGLTTMHLINAARG